MEVFNHLVLYVNSFYFILSFLFSTLSPVTPLYSPSLAPLYFLYFSPLTSCSFIVSSIHLLLFLIYLFLQFVLLDNIFSLPFILILLHCKVILIAVCFKTLPYFLLFHYPFSAFFPRFPTFFSIFQILSTYFYRAIFLHCNRLLFFLFTHSFLSCSSFPWLFSKSSSTFSLLNPYLFSTIPLPIPSLVSLFHVLLPSPIISSVISR